MRPFTPRLVVVGLWENKPLQINHGGRNIGVRKEVFRALERQFQALQENLRRGADVRRRDESENEVENEEPFEEEE